MSTKLAALVSLPLFVVACGSARTVAAPATTPSSLDVSAGAAGAAPAPSGHAADGADEASFLKSPLRGPGDYVVFRFTGKLEKRPVTLTERLVSAQDDVTIIDYTVEDAAGKRTMRARMVGAGTEQKVASAALMDGTIEGPVPASAVDAFLADTFVAMDTNGGAAMSEPMTVHVAGHTLDCTRTTYKVKVGRRDATMSVLASDGFAWGDVGAEVRTSDGTLLYKAELVGEGNAQSDVVAQQTP